MVMTARLKSVVNGAMNLELPDTIHPRARAGRHPLIRTGHPARAPKYRWACRQCSVAVEAHAQDFRL